MTINRALFSSINDRLMSQKSMNDKELIFEGNLISLYKERVEYRNNNGHTYFDIIKHPGGSVVAAIDAQDRICLLSQWRHALQQTIWELPAGCIETDEDPLVTAQRELEEEAGITADNWQALGTIAPSPGFSNEILYLYKATGLHAGTVNLDDAEQLEAHWLTMDEVNALINNNDIIDAKTLALLCKLNAL